MSQLTFASSLRAASRVDGVRRRRRGRALRVGAALGAVLATLTIAVAATPAWAAGDPSLDRLVVVEPVPGWSAYLPSPATLQELESALASANSVFGRASFALQYWRSPDGTQVLGILLARAPGVPVSDADLRRSASGSCTGGEVTPAHGVTPGYQVSCVEGSVGSPVQARVVSTAKESTLVLVISVANGGAPLPASQVTAIAALQQRALPTSPVPTLVGSLVLLFLVLVGIAVGATVWLVRRSSRRARAAFAAGPAPWAPPPPVAWPSSGPAWSPPGSAPPPPPVASPGTPPHAPGMSGGEAQGDDQAGPRR